jgi:hypothetical protein
MQVRNTEEWKRFRIENQGQYEKGIIGFAMRWADRMESWFDDTGSNVLDQIAEATMDEDERGIRLTNLQLAMAIAVLVRFWEYGGLLKLWYADNWRTVKARRAA